MGVAGDRRHRLDLGGEQRAEDQADPVGEGGARGVGGPAGGAPGVARNQGQPIAAGFEQRQLRSVEDRLAEPGIGTRQRHQQSHLGRPGGDRRRGRRGWRRQRLAVGRLRGDDRRRYHRRRHAGGQRGDDKDDHR